MPEEVVLTLLNTDCSCVESGECACDEYNCRCECGCTDCTMTIYGYGIHPTGGCPYCGGGNCACGGFQEED